MNYYNLGPGCNSQTIAITSNDKYLNPFNQVYLLKDRYAYTFPGYDNYLKSKINSMPIGNTDIRKPEDKNQDNGVCRSCGHY